MTTRKYSSRSQQTTLSAALTSSATTTTVVSGSTLVGGVTISAGETFTIVLDPDTALEEIVDVTAVSGNTLTITRGIDGSTGVAHSAGAVVRHMAIGRDYREANLHVEATTGHGATGAVVGTTNTQTLTNKDLSSATNTLSTSVVTLTGTQTLTNKTLTSPTITGTGAIAGTFTGALTGNVTGNVSGSAATAGTVTNGVYTTDTGTVTSTMIANNTIVNADINTAAAIDKTKISGTAITAGDTGTVTSTMIANDTIVNADVNTSAQIAYSKINATNSIVDADVNASAAIAWTKIAPSATVSTTELGYLDGVTSAVQTQLDGKLTAATAASTYAPLASPALTGTPTAPTATAGTNTTQVATTAYVGTAISNLVAGAPATLDTLDEIAAAIADTGNFSDTVVLKTGSTMSGALAMGTNKITGLGTPTASTDAATKGYIDTTVLAPSNLTGPITSVGAATTIASQTGTGTKFVVDNTPTLITPVLGVATATSINGTTIPTSKTLVATDSTTYVVPSQTGNNGKYLTTNGTTSSWGTIAAASGMSLLDSQTFTSSSTYTIPTGAKLFIIDCFSAGGGGGGGYRAATGTNCGGAAGAGGHYTRIVASASEFTTPITYTIGAGGTGGAGSTTNDTAGSIGTIGGTSRFGDYYFIGGLPGPGGVTTNLSGAVGYIISLVGPINTIGYGKGGNGSTATGGSGNAGFWGGSGGGGGAGGNGTTTANGGTSGAYSKTTISTTAASNGTLSIPSAGGVSGGTAPGGAGSAGGTGQGGSGGASSITTAGGAGGAGSNASSSNGAGGGGGGGGAVLFNGGAGGAGGNAAISIWVFG
jgi:hypothetical protein